MNLASIPEITPPIAEHSEEDFHSATDYLQASNRRKTVGLVLEALMIAALVGAVIYLAVQGRPVYVMAIAPNGEEYVVSSPKKQLDLQDEIVYKQVVQDLMSFSEAYFERSSVSAEKDYEKARWFLPDNLLSIYDATAKGGKGWIVGLMNHAIPESHATIDAVELRAADIEKEPFQARIYITRTSPSGQRQKTIATLTFVVRPELTKGWSRIPLYNALGLFIVKPIEEHADFRQ